MASQKTNDNEAVTVKTSNKSMKNRYEKVQDIFDKKNAQERVISGVGSKVTEMDELFGAMVDAREVIQRDKSTEKNKKRLQESEKDRMGKKMGASSLVRKSKDGPDF
ncbi:hypothetical protein BWQ96_01330 [Gracilariopsis chorda]|uniref:Uncharacterized protein n=1 Tax=Gracilariopsis chorda TaxID=448386 RepID=A0A2V3J318_9FLOR|nr:hypothetical protein BWQ96_01330 [Gracilariopsis chorda]|eukprot:PXF48774.1 hypothetical protein BWQ96_01330 [Gracilariopsis chorda]